MCAVSPAWDGCAAGVPFHVNSAYLKHPVYSGINIERTVVSGRLVFTCVAGRNLTGMADESLFDFLHMEMVSHVYREQQNSKGELDSKDRAVCVSVLESMGFRVGQGLIERLTRDSPSFKDELDVMKFICKDFWTKVFRRQVDNLRTNHQGTYVLQDNKFSLLTQLSNGKQYLDQAPKYLAFSCGVVRGALSNLGLESVVTAEVSVMPSCKFQVVIQKL